MTTDSIDELNEVLKEAEDTIFHLGLGVSGSVEIDDEKCQLHWRKEGPNWALYIQSQGSKSANLISNAGKRHRILAARALPRLLDVLRVAHARQDEEIKEAIQLVRDFITRCRSDL